MPSDKELEGYYSYYYKQDLERIGPVNPGSRHKVFRKWFHRITGDVDPRDFIEVSKGQRLLDYGCGMAGYLSDFHRRGVRVSGAEIAKAVVEKCQKEGFDVQEVKTFSIIPFEDAEFDVVYLMQVFEHLREPHLFMEELRRVSKPGATLYLAVPNSRSFWRRVFRENWISGWFAPFHLYHYNSHNLSQMAMQHGFEFVQSWSRTPSSWFRLNLKALFYATENRLDWNSTWLDGRLMRLIITIILRIAEIPVRERDCLVIQLRKIRN